MAFSPAATYGLTELQDESVLIPFPLMRYYTGNEILQQVLAQAINPDEVESVEKQIERLLKSRHPAEASYDVRTLTAILTAAQPFHWR